MGRDKEQPWTDRASLVGRTVRSEGAREGGRVSLLPSALTPPLLQLVFPLLLLLQFMATLSIGRRSSSSYRDALKGGPQVV